MANSLTRPGAVALAAIVLSGTSAPLLAQEALRAHVVPDLSRQLMCGPHAAVLPPAASLRIVSGEEPRRSVFGTADAVIINAGSLQGVRVGQEYFIRRIVSDRFALPVSGLIPLSIRTAGSLRVVEVAERAAIATISDACDGVLEGDYLEPFVRPVMPAQAEAGEPDFGDVGLIVLGNERRQIAGAGAMMVVDRGLHHGIKPGQRLTVFRTTLEGSGPIARIGQATAVMVHQDTSVIRIDSSRDAVTVGDRVAFHK
jgi:hypothetical protein